MAKFYRIPKKDRSNTVYGLKQNLDSFLGSLQKGGDLKMDELDKYISQLKDLKNKAKEFNSADEVKGTVYESKTNEKTFEEMLEQLRESKSKSNLEEIRRVYTDYNKMNIDDLEESLMNLLSDARTVVLAIMARNLADNGMTYSVRSEEKLHKSIMDSYKLAKSILGFGPYK